VVVALKAVAPYVTPCSVTVMTHRTAPTLRL
jgi:hypothetical protein